MTARTWRGKQDVVTLTVNHRVNSFGFLYLADVGGAKYAQHGQRRNAGYRRGAGMGARQHRQISAAIRIT